MSQPSYSPSPSSASSRHWKAEGCAAGITARADGKAYVTQNSYVNFLANTEKEEELLAETNVIRRGATIVAVHVELRTADGRKLADAVVDMFRIAGMPDIKR